MSSCCPYDSKSSASDNAVTVKSAEALTQSNTSHQTSSSCCGSDAPVHCHNDNAQQKSLLLRMDWLLWGSLIATSIFYLLHISTMQPVMDHDSDSMTWFSIMSMSVFELLNAMWWGVLIGIVMVAIVGRIPREFVMSMLGTNSGVGGLFRATAAGILLDLCSHGILMVGTKLYERGASAGQMIAFLVASPWNSFSLTLILIALIGFFWTIIFILLSMIIAILAGFIFDRCVAAKILPANPHQIDIPENFQFWNEAKQSLKKTQFTAQWFLDAAWDGVKSSRMVLRWLLFGVLFASAIRAFVPEDLFAEYFGPTLLGLVLTILAATIIEVCSEGSTPIAADLVTRANSPGNGFAFLMAGVATDYTEVMVLKDTTKSWRFALFLPLVTLPQVFVVACLLNFFG